MARSQTARVLFLCGERLFYSYHGRVFVFPAHMAGDLLHAIRECH